MGRLAIIGGGAAGLAAAVTAARGAAPARRSRRRGGVRGRRAGGGAPSWPRGNGRCNFSNARIDAGAYRNAAFVEAALGASAACLGRRWPAWRAGRDLRGCRPGPGACVLRRLGPRAARGGRGASLPAGQQGDERARRAAGGCGGLRCGGGVRAARRAARRARPSGRPLPPPLRRRDGGARRRRGARHGRAHGARAARRRASALPLRARCSGRCAPPPTW